MVFDFFSDTQTMPTNNMLEAMYNAKLGDDVSHADPTVNKLEKLAAEKVGKEAALFVPSGTMGNLLALMTHTRPGEEVILEAESHIYYYEVGGFSRIAGLAPRLVPGENGVLSPDGVKKALRESDLHYPDTSLLCIENSHNRGGGTVTSLERTEKLCDLAHEQGLKVHIDGARIFNAVLYLGVDPDKLVARADSVMFCLSKGLSAPVGSILAGTGEFVAKARKNRKLVGGGMRQAGVLAAAGIIALEEMADRLQEDHDNARLLARGISSVNEININLKTVQTNIVQFDITPLGISSQKFAEKLIKNGVRVSTRPPAGIRMVTNRHISEKEVEKAVKTIKQVVEEIEESEVSS